MAFKIYDTQAEVPEGLQEHYAEVDGKWVPQVDGAPSKADLERVNTALTAERAAHQETAAKLTPFEKLGKTHEEITAAIQELGEAKLKLEAAGEGGKFDQAEYDALVARKVEIETAPLQRQIETLTTERDTAKTEAGEVAQQLVRRDLAVELTNSATAAKMDADAIPFFVASALDRFEKAESTGAFQTKRIPGDPQLPGLSAEQYVNEAKKTQGFLWPRTDGMDMRPGDPQAGLLADNPWRPGEHWNKSGQSRIFAEKGADHAKRMAQAAGAGDDPTIVRHPKDVEAMRPTRAA